MAHTALADLVGKCIDSLAMRSAKSSSIRRNIVKTQPRSYPLTSAPGTTRTCDLGIRRPLLYPPELRGQCAGESI
jgi:hypothetical protein